MTCRPYIYAIVWVCSALRSSSVLYIDLQDTDPDLKGFKGGFSDGTHGYVIPHNNGGNQAWFGKVARFRLATFDAVTVLDLATVGNDPELKGFSGGFCDSNYGYVLPAQYGKIAKFDLATFSNVTVFNFGGGDPLLMGFDGGFSDGTSGYLIPRYNAASATYFGKVVKFNLFSFDSPVVLNLATTDSDLVGFYGGGFQDGTYGYTVTHRSASGYNGKVARFDLATFSTVTLLDLKQTHPHMKGYHGSFTDGTYGYAVPNYNSDLGQHGKIGRFDLATFSTVTTLDLTQTSVGGHNTLKGYVGGFADGTYGYCVPYQNGAQEFGKVGRFDLATFTTVTVLDLTQTQANLKGFDGHFHDGTYAYLVPFTIPANKNGKVPRFSVGGILLTTIDPPDGATSVRVTTHVVLTFNKPVAAGTGIISFTPMSGSPTIDRPINVLVSDVLVKGKTATINPDVNLAAGMKYSVTMAPGVFKEPDWDGDFAGLSGTMYTFTTAFGACNTNPPEDLSSVSLTPAGDFPAIIAGMNYMDPEHHRRRRTDLAYVRGGSATSGMLQYPMGLAIDPSSQDLYIAEGYDPSGIDSNLGKGFISKVDTAGIITMIAGGVAGQNRTDGVLATEFSLHPVWGLAFDKETKDLYFTEHSESEGWIRKVDGATGVIITISAGPDFSQVRDITMDSFTKELYVSAFGTDYVWKINTTGGAEGILGPGNNPRGHRTIDAAISAPRGVALDDTSSERILYVADNTTSVTGSRILRKISLSTGFVCGVIQPHVVNTSDPNGLYVSELGEIATVAFDPVTGDLYAVDEALPTPSVRWIHSASGLVYPMSATVKTNGDFPRGLAIDVARRNLYVSFANHIERVPIVAATCNSSYLECPFGYTSTGLEEGSLASCCTPLARCNTLDCPDGFVLKSQASSIPCAGLTCDAGQDKITCCDDAPKAKCSTLQCPTGFASKLAASSIDCQGWFCDLNIDTSTCCNSWATCSSLSCPLGFALKFDAASIQCQATICDAIDDLYTCCVQRCMSKYGCADCGLGRDVALQLENQISSSRLLLVAFPTAQSTYTAQEKFQSCGLKYDIKFLEGGMDMLWRYIDCRYHTEHEGVAMYSWAFVSGVFRGDGYDIARRSCDDLTSIVAGFDISGLSCTAPEGETCQISSVSLES